MKMLKIRLQWDIIAGRKVDESKADMAIRSF